MWYKGRQSGRKSGYKLRLYDFLKLIFNLARDYFEHQAAE